MTNDPNDRAVIIGGAGAPHSRHVIVPEPKDGRWRMTIPIVGIAWILLHLVIPSRYYAEDADAYDERFAWRMFSSVRVRQCHVAVTETSTNGERALALMEILPAPWVALLERNRPAVVDRFLRWRCDHEGTERLLFVNTCVDATGDALPAVARVIDCETGEITTPSDEAPGGDGGTGDGEADR